MKYISSIIGLMVLLATLPLAAQSVESLRILHTGDTHSRIEPVSPKSDDRYANMGGVVRRATFVKQYRNQYPDVLLFDSGDFSQGTLYYNFFRGELEVETMNLMKYDAITIGNHEFDFGIENMARLFRMAHFPVVCANYDVTGTALEGLVKPYIVIERMGLRIGVFGVSPRLEGLVSAANCAGVVYKDPIVSAQTTADILKKEEKCDVVICLSHLGIEVEGPHTDKSDKQLIAGTRHIDLVLGGHSHTFMEKPLALTNIDGEETYLFHSGGNGLYVSEMELTFTPKK